MGSRNTNLSGKVAYGDLHILANADYGQIHVEGGKQRNIPTVSLLLSFAHLN